MQQLDLIIKSEEQFAREVALGVVVTRPLKSWLYFIPGMFIVDFLRRQGAVRRYLNEYMAPRRPAIYAAKAIMEGEDSEQVHAQIESQPDLGRTAGQGKTEHLKQSQFDLIEMLIKHYSKLLAAEGIDYIQLLRNAYKDKASLEAELSGLNELEIKRDQCMVHFDADDHQKRTYNAIHGQVAMRRKQLVEAVF